VCWVSDRGCFIRDENGNIVCWQGIILDITKQKLAEQELRKREKLYRTLAGSIPQTAVLLFDRDFRYTLAEGALLEKYGFLPRKV
jgi:PAS domain-containing protein